MHSFFYRATSAYYICLSSKPHISRQITLQFSSFAKMNGGSKDGFGQLRRGQLGSNPNANSANPHYPSVSKPTTYEDEFPPLSASVNSSSKSRRLNKRLPAENSLTLEDEVSVPPRFRKTGMASRCKRKGRVNSFTKNAVDVGNSDCSECIPKIEPFDICHSESRNFSRREILRPGMVLLKRYITHVEQVKIVKKCQELGLGTGGFYQPSFRNGGRLHLQMMCLGLNWDPETREYGEIRAVDGSKPPDIPHEFSLLVERAILDSHDLIKMDLKEGNVEDILPRMSPNICIVNFYTTSGRLGLHQDRDESMESLLEGLPVVSFSFGDSAEFLYGDQRDVNKAERVRLESGDVLIFGGKSRHIFHGVQSIIPDTAPFAPLEESDIRPGRLNLTFRQF